MASPRKGQLGLPAVSNEVVPRVVWGGRRKGAGRKRAVGARASVAHRVRPAHQAANPVHVTLRAARGLPSLRSQRVSEMLRSVLFGQKKRRYARSFQVVEVSIQDNHVHLIVEAVGKDDASDSLRSGVSGLVIAFAKRLNRMLGRRGKVWGDRWHGRDLATPREVRNALVYVFRNVVRHGARVFGEGIVDPFSSAWRFKGWTRPVVELPSRRPWPDPRPRTWLLERGWKIHGLLDPREVRRA